MTDTTKTVLSVLGIAALVVAVILLMKFAPKGGVTPTDNGAPTTQAPTTGTNQPLFEKLAPIAGSIGINQNQFLSCVNSDQPEGVVAQDVALGTQLGVKGTPYFVVILNTSTAYAVPGALPEETFRQMLDSGTVPEGFTALDQEMLGDVLAATQDKTAATKMGAGKYDGIQIVEFADIDCPFCQQIHPVMEKFAAEGVRWTYLHFPLVSLHPNAHDKAIASVCVFNQGGSDAFFKFIDLLMI